MITQKVIGSSAWVALTTAGQSGTVWMDEEGNGKRGKADCRIFHTTGTPDDDDLTTAKKIYQSNGNDDVMIISADSSTDVYYARCRNDSDQVILTVDVV